MDFPQLHIQDVHCSFAVGNGESLRVLDGVDVRVNANEFVSVIGPSGGGKSTLFNIIAGLVAPDSGRVLVDGTDVTGHSGHVAYQMQKDLLLGWRTVLHNVILGPELARRPRAEAIARAHGLMQRFGLDGFESFYPAALSGGMRQRAALMRTILCDKQVWLLDEPFGALDALTRADLHEWLLGIWRDFRRTIVLITHDPEEAVFLSDRIYITTSRPMRIKGVIEVDLPRPRDQEITASAEFGRIKRDVLHLVRDGEARGPTAPVQAGL